MIHSHPCVGFSYTLRIHLLLPARHLVGFLSPGGLMNWVVCMHNGRVLKKGCSQWSRNFDMFSVGLLQLDTIGLIGIS